MGKCLLSSIAFSVVSLISLPSQATMNTLLVYGDSLSAAYGLEDINQGWVTLLQQRIVEKGYPWKIANASVSGDTTANGLSRFPKVLQQTKPDLVLIELGANDGLQGKNPKHMASNLEQMISLSQQNQAQVILFEMMILPNYGPAYSVMFNKAFHQLGDKWNVPVLPFFLNGVAGDKAMNQADGIHPTAQAQPLILENVWRTLEPVLQKFESSDVVKSEATDKQPSA